ncbi:MAG: hypothetical protein M3396_08000 [Actinomycetota bacterium]|nr:hypothetical protein [Actinomycetota bacterium]
MLPQARELTGFKGGVALVDRDGGNIFSFTLWENEEAMRASEEAGNRLRGQAASDLGSPRPWSSATKWAFWRSTESRRAAPPGIGTGVARGNARLPPQAKFE